MVTARLQEVEALWWADSVYLWIEPRYLTPLVLPVGCSLFFFIQTWEQFWSSHLSLGRKVSMCISQNKITLIIKIYYIKSGYLAFGNTHMTSTDLIGRKTKPLLVVYINANKEPEDLVSILHVVETHRSVHSQSRTPAPQPGLSSCWSPGLPGRSRSSRWGWWRHLGPSELLAGTDKHQDRDAWAAIHFLAAFHCSF